MNHVWLSPGLPVDHRELGEVLGSDYELLPPSSEVPPVPAGGDSGEPASTEPTLLVVAAFEDGLVRALGGRPPEHALVVVTPPGSELSAELRRDGRPDVVGSAASVAELAALVQAAAVRSPALDWAGTPWAAAGQAGVLGAAAGPAEAGTGGRRFSRGRLPRRAGMLIAGLAAAALLLGGGTALGLALADDDDSDSSRTPVAFGAPADGDRPGRALNGLPDAGYGLLGPRGRLSEQQRDEFAQCMADNGVSLGQGALERERGEMGTQVRDALRECLPQRGESGDETS